MDMQPMHAAFEHQEQAEEAIRKLASLRANRFRMERAIHSPDFGSATAANAANLSELTDKLLSSARVEAASELGTEPSVPFSLSAHVPAEAFEQAKKVITQAGGSII